MLFVENGFRFGRVTTFLCRLKMIISILSWKWLPIRKGYDFQMTPASFNAWYIVENGFRFGRVTTTCILGTFETCLCWKWLPIRKGYDPPTAPGDTTLSPVENGFRFGRVTTFFTNAQLGITRWKWLPIRKGYDWGVLLPILVLTLLKMASDSEGLRQRFFHGHPTFKLSWKWLPIRKGYDFESIANSVGEKLCWKWLPIRKGYDLNSILLKWSFNVENGFRFGRVTTICLLFHTPH